MQEVEAPRCSGSRVDIPHPQQSMVDSSERAEGWPYLLTACRAPEVDMYGFLSCCLKSTLSLNMVGSTDDDTRRCLEYQHVAAATEEKAGATQAAKSFPIEPAGYNDDVGELPLRPAAEKPEGFSPLKTGAIRHASEW